MPRHALALLLAACAGDPPTDAVAPGPPPPDQPADARGPYEAGVTTLVVARDGLHPLTVELWYPAAPAAGTTPGGYEDGGLRLAGGAFRDAPPDPRGGPRPVVAFSHGFGGLRFQSVFLTEHLARHGFVVVAPDHVGSSLLDFRPDEVGTLVVYRPLDVAAAVDLLDNPVVPGLLVDTSRYAVVGHSFGAWTALVVGGGVLDVPGYEAACATDARPTCRFLAGQGLDADAAASFATPDPRAAVTVALAPGGYYAFGQDGEALADVRTPLVLGGTRDGDMPFEREILPTFQRMGVPRWLGTLRDAGHWGFTDLCALLPVEDCAGASHGYMEPARTRALTRALVLAHVRRHLLDRVEDEVTLVGDSDLVWTAE